MKISYGMLSSSGNKCDLFFKNVFTITPRKANFVLGKVFRLTINLDFNFLVPTSYNKGH